MESKKNTKSVFLEIVNRVSGLTTIMRGYVERIFGQFEVQIPF